MKFMVFLLSLSLTTALQAWGHSEGPFFPGSKDGSVVSYPMTYEASQMLYENLAVREVQGSDPSTAFKVGKNLTCTKFKADDGQTKHICMLLLAHDPKTGKFNGRAGDSRRIK